MQNNLRIPLELVYPLSFNHYQYRNQTQVKLEMSSRVNPFNYRDVRSHIDVKHIHRFIIQNLIEKTPITGPAVCC